MAKPVLSIPVRLGFRFWVRVILWPRASDAPDNSEGRDAAYFIADDSWPRKLGDVHLGRNFLDIATIVHEGHHVIAELQRRMNGTRTAHGEEWCAQQMEKFVSTITNVARSRGESIR